MLAYFVVHKRFSCNQICHNPGSWMRIHTYLGSDSWYSSGVRFIRDTTCRIYLNQIRLSNLKYIIRGPEGLIKYLYRPWGADEVCLPFTVYRPCGTNEVYLTSVRVQWSVYTIPAGLIKCVYRTYRLYLPFTVPVFNHLKSCVMIRIWSYCELPTTLLLIK